MVSGNVQFPPSMVKNSSPPAALDSLYRSIKYSSADARQFETSTVIIDHKTNPK